MNESGSFVGWIEYAECGVLSAECGVRSAECGVRGVWKIGVDGNALTLTGLFISKHFNAFIQHKKCLEMF